MREMRSITGVRPFFAVLFMALSFLLILSGCSREKEQPEAEAEEAGASPENGSDMTDDEAEYTLETKVTEVINDPVFGDYALELSEKGYNAFALIYRPGADTACEDLARAIAFLHENAEELQIDMADYSLWGGSAGARMAAWLGAYGTEAFGEEAYPDPAAVIMQYTGLSDVTGEEPPTYACVGTSDGIASYRSMESYISRIQDTGTDAEIEVFDGLRHGFGLGEGTVAEGWIDRAVSFWERNMEL